MCIRQRHLSLPQEYLRERVRGAWSACKSMGRRLNARKEKSEPSSTHQSSAERIFYKRPFGQTKKARSLPAWLVRACKVQRCCTLQTRTCQSGSLGDFISSRSRLEPTRKAIVIVIKSTKAKFRLRRLHQDDDDDWKQAGTISTAASEKSHQSY